jgi:2-oxoglutarate ferredoxin oxidoreductase subunit alpha
MLSVEMSAGQMVEDVRLAVNGKVPVEHYGRFGGVVHSPEEVVEALKQKFIGE